MNVLSVGLVVFNYTGYGGTGDGGNATTSNTTGPMSFQMNGNPLSTSEVLAAHFRDYKPIAGNTVIYLDTASSSPWSVPADWNNGNNSIECIGAGGGGTNASESGGAGGGAYARSINLTLSGTVVFGVGVGGAGTNNTTTHVGGNTWFNAASLAAAVTAGSGAACGAQGGQSPSGALGAAGGSTVVGTLTYAGGRGGIQPI